MSGILVRQWWALILRGLFSALFGALALVWPGATLTSLILLFGLYSLVHGVFALAAFAINSELVEDAVAAGTASMAQKA